MGPIACTVKGCEGGFVRPNCVLFGQSLPSKYHSSLEEFTRSAGEVDLLIVMGTSLSVEPVSQLPQRVNWSAVRVVMNLERTAEIDAMFDFDGVTERRRDVFVPGKCDESVHKLCARSLMLFPTKSMINCSMEKKAEIDRWKRLMQ